MVDFEFILSSNDVVINALSLSLFFCEFVDLDQFNLQCRFKDSDKLGNFFFTVVEVPKLELLCVSRNELVILIIQKHVDRVIHLSLG